MSCGGMDRAELRARFERRYPAREFLNSGDPGLTFKGGDVFIPELFGWLVTLGVQAGADKRVFGELELRTDWKAPADVVVTDFSVDRGGRLLVPWPVFELHLRSEDGGDEEEPSRAVANLTPLFLGEPGPPGVTSMLYGRTTKVTGEAEDPPETATFDIPLGATEYRVLPAGGTTANLKVSVEAGGEVVSSYKIDADTVGVAAGTETGEAAWRQTPASAGAKIVVVSPGEDDTGVTVFWRFDLGAMR